MKLFGIRQWIFSVIGLIGGLILGGYVLKTQYGEINYWIIGLIAFIGLAMIIFIGRYANK